MDESHHSFTHDAMSTAFEIIICGHDNEYARQASGAVFSEFDRIERHLSKYDAGSDVGQINLLEPGESMRVGVETLECLKKATWAYEVSNGLFDPTLGTGFRKLVIDASNFSIGWKNGFKGTLDLGGIGKGYAIDKAAEILDDWGVSVALINGGTSTVMALGKPWKLGVGGPWGEAAGITSVELQDQALSGSGTEVKGGHIINPKTGKPAERHLAAWAVHSSAAVSDALSTAFMMMDEEKISQLCRTNPGTVAYVVKPDERLIKIGV
jgi:thiamine biosynthesis lipoprotein